MARKKRYTKTLFVVDTLLTLITGGAWLLVVGFREVWYRL